MLVNAGVIQGLVLLRTLAQALRLWAWGGVGCDLVVINAEPASYLMALQREIADLRDRHLADSAADGANSGRTRTGFFLLRTDDLSAAELGTLEALARVRIDADGRPLLHHLQAWTERHEQALEDRQLNSSAELTVASDGVAVVPAPVGRFDAASGEFRFDVSAALRPTRPWINVLANPGFGSQVSEAGLVQ